MNYKPLMLGGLAAILMLQPLTSHAFAVALPHKIVNVKYPDTFKDKMNEVAVCLLEAESTLYSDKLNAILPDLNIKKDRSCREILESKYYAENLTFNVNFQSGGVINPSSKQDRLTILDQPLKANEFYRETESLEIALRMFIELNEDFTFELSEIRKENDMMDMLYLRLFNLLNELPKAQKHPLLTEFIKDIRDSYLRVNPSELYRAFVYFAYDNNKDEALNDTLLRYVAHIELSSDNYDDFIPDENLPLYSDAEDTTPDLPSQEEQDELIFDNLETTWDSFFKEELDKLETENDGVTIESSADLIDEETEIDYVVEDDQCLKITKIYRDDELISEKTKQASKSEEYRCGIVEYTPRVSSEEVSEEAELNVYYKYQGGDWIASKIELIDDLDESLSCSYLTDLLIDISTEHGLGYLKDMDRYLFVISNKALVLNSYDEDKTLTEINDWLCENGADLQLGRAPQDDKPDIGLNDLK